MSEINNYKNGQIYTIRNKDDSALIYVGFTTKNLNHCLRNHKHAHNNINNKDCNSLLYSEMRVTNINDWYIELFEKITYNNKEELNKKKGEVIRQVATLNKRIEGRTKKEYRQDNAEKIKAQDKIYKQKKNKEKLELINQQKRNYPGMKKIDISNNTNNYYS